MSTETEEKLRFATGQIMELEKALKASVDRETYNALKTALDKQNHAIREIQQHHVRLTCVAAEAESRALELLSENERLRANHKPRTLCRIGWHRWTKWNVRRGIIRSIATKTKVGDAIRQDRYCQDCGFHQEKIDIP